MAYSSTDIAHRTSPEPSSTASWSRQRSGKKDPLDPTGLYRHTCNTWRGSRGVDGRRRRRVASGFCGLLYGIGRRVPPQPPPRELCHVGPRSTCPTIRWSPGRATGGQATGYSSTQRSWEYTSSLDSELGYYENQTLSE
ncbi:unnamed protein product [Notodromas monacha]|uniref:Uncharacterized protein n=1 Tax=Notodromas monacha TaxID=399045 RepID=A0A7R9BYR4_9CRUS|nr:unnamed protein product [Notodromas monacha]CAG0923826.1 unnamed protein product [Notodromas monacha]